MRLSAVIMVLTLFSGCEAIYSPNGPVGKALKEEVRNARKTVIHLSNLTPFEWDEAYFYDPYTPRQIICEDLGISEKSCPQEITDESTDDGQMYLVFRKSGNIVHKEMYSRFNGDLAPVEFALPLKPKSAIFDVHQEDVSANGKPWYRLRLRASASIKPDKDES